MKFQDYAVPLKLVGAVLAISLTAFAFSNTSRARLPVPAPAIDSPLQASPRMQSAVFAGGCFWGLEAVFEHVRGVGNVVSGYAGGDAASANYSLVGSGRSGHAESVRIEFDPAVVSYGQLLNIYFSVAHDPTQLDRQGPDRGPQYRSEIFYSTPDQQRIARAYVTQMTAAKTFGNAPIVTRIEPLQKFYPAEAYHQDFARLNPAHPYIVFHDAPKVVRLKARFPAMYREYTKSVAAVAPSR